MPLFAALLSVPLPERYLPLNLTPQRQRQKTQEALVAWLLEEAERQPVLAVWEDLHWADPSTLDVLSLMLDQVSTARMLTLLTYRPEFRPPWATHAPLTQVTLNRLGRAQVEMMIPSHTGDKTLPTELRCGKVLISVFQCVGGAHPITDAGVIEPILAGLKPSAQRSTSHISQNTHRQKP